RELRTAARVPACRAKEVGGDPDGDARRRAKAGLRRAAAGSAESRGVLPSIGSGREFCPFVRPAVTPLARARPERLDAAARCGSRWLCRSWFSCRLVSAQRLERSTHLLAEELGLLPRGEVATLVNLVEVDDVRVRRLDPAARRPPDLARERREAERDRRRRQRLLAGS